MNIGGNRRMLVVDDDRTFTKLLADYYGQIGYHVTSAHCPESAKDAIWGEEYDAILIDAKLGDGACGLELCQELKDAGVLSPVVMITGCLSAAIKGSAAGSAGWIMKPFSPEELSETLARLPALARAATWPPACSSAVSVTLANALIGILRLSC